MNETRKQVLVDITIAAPVDTVWTALRDPAQIRQWFGWDSPSLSEEIKYIFADTAKSDAANRVIQFDEWEGEGISERIELTTVAGGTHLRLVRSGGAPIDWTGVYEDISQGWITFFQQLRLAVEKHPREDRRTIYLSGPSRPGIGEPSRELGLGAATSLEPGAAYAAPLAVGEGVSGQVWFQTYFQTALTVEQWGNGLMVVTDMGVSPSRPHGGGSVLLTTYGQSEADFDALSRAWTEWWRARYPGSAA